MQIRLIKLRQFLNLCFIDQYGITRKSIEDDQVILSNINQVIPNRPFQIIRIWQLQIEWAYIILR